MGTGEGLGLLLMGGGLILLGGGMLFNGTNGWYFVLGLGILILFWLFKGKH